MHEKLEVCRVSARPVCTRSALARHEGSKASIAPCVYMRCCAL